MNKPNPTPIIIFHSEAEEKLFTETLNRSFCAVSHFSERITDVAEGPDFKDMKPYLVKAMKFAEEKSAVYDKIYELVAKKHDFEKCNVLIGLLEELFDNIRLGDKTSGIRELLIINYLDFINYTTNSSFSILKFLTKPINNPTLHLLINTLDSRLVIGFPSNQ